MGFLQAAFNIAVLVSYQLVLLLLDVLSTVLYWGRGRTVPPVLDPLLHLSATEMAAKIRTGEVKSEEVVRAYVARIQEVDPLLNAAVERRFQEALREARGADLEARSHAPQLLATERPLLGVPVTVKAHIKVKGMPCTAGSLLLKDVVSDEDAPSVAMLRGAGAVVLACSNMPEFGMDLETSNLLYGRTSNPYSTNRGVCGSSGGEAALLGAGASVLGLGSDTAGSIRLPAAFCGVYGHKPTRGLVSNDGFIPPFEFVRHLFLELGPMCRYAEDLPLAMEILTTDKSIQFRKKVNFKDMKIYYWKNLNGFLPVKIEKGIAETIEKALNHFQTTYGIQPQEVHIPELKNLIQIMTSTFMPDIDKNNIASALHVPGLGHPDFNLTLELLKFTVGLSKLTFGPLFHMFLLQLPIWYKEEDVPFLREQDKKLRAIFHQMLEEDAVLLCPTTVISAPYHRATLRSHAANQHAYVFNYLGLPATHCPLGLNSKGMPVGLQVVAGKYNDSLTLACAMELQKAFGGWVPPNGVQDNR